MTAVDLFHLQRFIDAQDALFEQALTELRAGRKRSHWMWFVFPQIRGLGLSAMSARFAVQSLDEARAYLAHPLLGPRLNACVAALNALPGNDAAAVLGDVDAKNLHSSLTLFSAAAEQDAGPFTTALLKYFDGRLEYRTVQTLEATPLEGAARSWKLFFFCRVWLGDGR